MEIAVDMAGAREVLDAAEVPTEGRWAWINERKWLHRQKMERKELDRYERGMRRTAQYERTKGNAPLTVRRMRKWLKSPYAFRHPRIPVDDGSRGLTARALQKFREAMREHVL